VSVSLTCKISTPHIVYCWRR